DAFDRAGVPFAEAGAWSNLVAPSPEVRQRNFDYVCRRLALADELGARCCVDYLGTYDPNSDFGPHPDNLTPAAFDAAVEVVRRVVDTVRPRRAKFALEMMQWVLPDSVEVYLDLIRAVDRPAFAAHVDPVNLILTPRQYYDTGGLIRHIFAMLGPHVVSCHGKDIVLRNQLALHFDEIRPGLGAMDYRTYVREIAQLGRDVPLMLEHLSTQEEFELARRHIVGCAESNGGS
ncbi:MAG TPA: TIM barrel protein, partial [Tepidisphaeraceae bacterium]|nr:TIM barrel protein [Tepidisphaeraceae bacterium]